MGQCACATGMLQCSFGMAPSNFMVLPDKMILTENKPMANIMDNKPDRRVGDGGCARRIDADALHSGDDCAMGARQPDGACKKYAGAHEQL